jgi:mannitol/fructose-specific phosphotransferase system IIA component (Ntr-type)
MKIWKKISPDRIFLDVPLPNKDNVLRFVADVCEQKKVVTDAQAVYNGLKAREETMSTGVGNGVAFPHTANPEAEDAAVLLIRPHEPVDFDSLDNLPADIIVGLIIPKNKTALHLQLLAGVSRLCRNRKFLSAVRQTGDPKDLWETIRMLEEEMPFH